VTDVAALDSETQTAGTAPAIGGSQLGNTMHLRAEDIVKHFRGVHALDGVSLTITPGEIVGLIGPNGSGKTTLLNVLSGIYAPTSGGVFCNGARVNGYQPNRIAHLGVGRTFQNIRLFGHLTVRQNIEVGSVSGRKVDGADHVADVAQLLDRFNLEPVAGQQGLSLPYGAQRRVEIARALAGRPHFLLLDEPAAGMNEAESDQLLETIVRVRQEFGCGILIVDHDLRLIMRLCERVHVLAEGRTLAEGTPEEVRNDAQVIEVFLGDALKEA
jgi:ABC-type branched-subunit amino acid transport system ATPase component